MQILIEYAGGEKRAPLEVDPLETVEMLKLKLYSLTGVPPSQQQLLGLANSGLVLTDLMQVKQLALQEGQRIIVTAKLKPMDATAAALAASASVATTAASSAPSATAVRPPVSVAAPLVATAGPRMSPQPFVSLDGCCSRSFFGSEALVQPAAFATAAGTSTPICYACAGTCHLPNELKPRVSLGPFVCGCAEIPGRECIFAVRALAAADLLAGNMATQVRSMMSAAASKINEQALAQGQNMMQARIGSHIRAVLEYEQPDWQAAALRVIPLDKLQERAQKAMQPGGDSTTLAPRDALMWQLLVWFKHEFFQWVNSPACDRCGGGTSNIGGTAPNAAEAPFRPGVVELYKCASASCAAVTRFPRYNHGVKLLETRKGRCGEWAQAFTLCCRALGFEARSANDWTDHVSENLIICCRLVGAFCQCASKAHFFCGLLMLLCNAAYWVFFSWTEYFSDTEGRWIHVDPCECRRDAPHLYEGGWGKKLTYVIATSKDEVVDVTRRYSKRYNSEVLERRTACPEGWLRTYCISLTQMKAMMLPQARREELAARRVREEAEFAANEAEERAAKAAAAAEAAAASAASSSAASSSAAAASAGPAAPSVPIKEEEHQGRTTGSVEWRAARGELGADAVAVARALQPDKCVSGPAASSSSSTAATSSSATAAAADERSAASKALCSTDPTAAASAAMKQLAVSNGAAVASSPAVAASASSSAAAASSGTSAPAPAPAALPLADPLAQAKARTALLFKQYVTQLTRGCGSSSCDATQCRSNAAFVAPEPAQVPKVALELTKSGAGKLCPRVAAATTPATR